MVQRTWPLTSDFVWSWYICYSTKLYRREHSSWAWRLYRKLASRVPVHGGNFRDKWLSAFLVLLLARPLTLTWTGGWHYLCMTFENDSRSLTWTVCGRCLHSWRCYKQTRPLARVLPNRFVRNWQRLKGRPSWYCFAVPFGRLFEDGTRWRVFAWCPESSITMIRTWKWTTNLYWWRLSWADHGAILLHQEWFQHPRSIEGDLDWFIMNHFW